MPHLSTLISSDSRPLLARVRRCKLHEIATGEGIPFPDGAASTIMLPLLEHVNHSVLLKYLKVEQVVQEDEMGRQHIETYPVVEEHMTAKSQEFVAGVLLDRISPDEDKKANKKAAFDDERLKALEKENSDLKELINSRLAKLEALDDQPFPIAKLMPWQLIQMAKERGIEYKGLEKEELVSALGG